MAVLPIEERQALLANSRYRSKNDKTPNKAFKNKRPPKRSKASASSTTLTIPSEIANNGKSVSLAEFKAAQQEELSRTEAIKNNPHLSEIVRMEEKPELIQKEREHYEQTLYFSWLYTDLPEIHSIACAVANGGNRQKFEGFRLTAEGVKKGWPDTQICEPAHGYPGLFIEFKKTPGEYRNDYERKHAVKESQITLLRALKKRGYACYVAFGFEEAKKITLAYLNNNLDQLELFFDLDSGKCPSLSYS